MSQLTEKYLPVLKRINKLADKNKKEYVRKCNREFINCLSECSTNVLPGKVPLSSRQGAKLKRNEKDLRLLSAKMTSLRKKRHIVQKGGFCLLWMPTLFTNRLGFAFHVDELFPRELQISFR